MKISALTILAIVLGVALFVEESWGQGGRERQRNRRRRTNRNRNGNRRRIGGRTRITTQQPCPPIPHIDNGQGLDTGNTVQYACEPGFVLEGTNVITCLNGRWTVAPRCRRQLCPIPQNVPFASVPQLSNGGVTATYTCLPGYSIIGGNGVTVSVINCLTQTQFWPNLPACEQILAISCSGPPSITHAVSTVSNNIATYTCMTGYRIRVGSPSRITCRNQGWPTVGLPVCERDPNTIPDPTKCTKAPPCGSATITRETAGDSYTIGSSVKYTCVTGHRIVGPNNNQNNSASVYCKSDGTWTVTPTCEPVVCGVPPVGTNTVAIVTNSISFGGVFVYGCITNYQTSSSLETRCLADGNWSLDPPPVCIQITCSASALPALPNADFLSQSVVVGGTVTYTCRLDFRLAPASNPTVIERAQTITCLANGTFTPLARTCVFLRPESCRDFYARDNLFSAASQGCQTVIIDPQGPGVGDPNNPGEASVQCCKQGLTNFCTMVSPSGGAAGSTQAGIACAGTSSAVLPSTGFIVATSATCGTATTVTYPIDSAQIISMIRSSGGSCQQTTTITCTTPDSLALALRCNGEPSGFIYGTNAFELRGTTTGDDIALTHYAYIGRTCDCASNGLITASSTACVDGCECTAEGAAPSGTDTITKHLTAINPAYVTAFQITQHDTPDATPAANNAFSVSVGPIECCEVF